MTAFIFPSLTSPSWLWFWESLEFISIIIVGVGCWGEVWAEHHKFKERPNSLMPATFINKKFERFFWLMVVWGLAIELIAFGFAFKASNNEILELQAKLQPRTIDVEQIYAIENSLKGAPRGKILIDRVNDPSAASLAFILQVIFDQLGYDVEPKFPGATIIVGQVQKSGHKFIKRFDGIEVWHNDKEPSYGLAIEKALKSANVPIEDVADPLTDASTVKFSIYERP